MNVYSTYTIALYLQSHVQNANFNTSTHLNLTDALFTY